MKSRFFLNIVVGKCAAVLQLLAGEDEALLIGWDSLFILNLRFHIVNRVRRFDIQRDSFASEGLHKDLHSTTKTEHQMKSRFFLNVVVGKRATILQLLAGEDEA